MLITSATWTAAGAGPWRSAATNDDSAQHNLSMCQVLCRKGGAVALSRDQTAERVDERARVQAAGGDVRKRMDGWRVGDVGLQVTRCASACVHTRRLRHESWNLVIIM